MTFRKGGDQMMLDWEAYRQELLGRIGDHARLSRQTLPGDRELSDAGNKTAHLDAKTRGAHRDCRRRHAPM
jgi:hypothetical protein